MKNRLAGYLSAGAMVMSLAAVACGGALSRDIKNSTHQTFEVPVGTTVMWTNQDRAPHTTTSGTPGDETGVWTSDFLQQGDSFSFTFNQVGSFAYFCVIHPSMTATVTVVESGSASAGGSSSGSGYEYP